MTRASKQTENGPLSAKIWPKIRGRLRSKIINSSMHCPPPEWNAWYCSWHYAQSIGMEHGHALRKPSEQYENGPESVFYSRKNSEKQPFLSTISQLSRDRRRFMLRHRHIRMPLVELHNGARGPKAAQQIFDHQNHEWTKVSLTKSRISLVSPQP